MPHGALFFVVPLTFQSGSRFRPTMRAAVLPIKLKSSDPESSPGMFISAGFTVKVRVIANSVDQLPQIDCSTSRASMPIRVTLDLKSLPCTWRSFLKPPCWRSKRALNVGPGCVRQHNTRIWRQHKKSLGSPSLKCTSTSTAVHSQENLRFCP